MRTPLPPHSGHRLVRKTAGSQSDDTIALWRCDEVGGASLVDATGIFPALTAIGAPPSTDGLFAVNASGQGARILDGSSHFFRGALPASPLPALTGEWTTEAWFKTDTITGGNHCIVGFGGLTDGVLADNHQLLVCLNNAEVRFFWEHGSGINESGVTTGANVLVDTTYHLGVVRRFPVSGNPGFFDIVVYLRDLDTGTLFTQTFLEKQGSDGGTNARWIVGATPRGFGDKWDGALDDIRITGAALSLEAVRESFARGARDYDADLLYSEGFNDVHGRVLVENGEDTPVFEDLTDLFSSDFLETMDWDADIDDAASTATFTCRREIYDASLSPQMEGSPINQPTTGVFKPLLESVRKVKFETATVPRGWDAPIGDADWELQFQGFLSEINWGQPVITVRCRDRSGPLADTFIRQDNVEQYGDDITPIALETELRKLVNDNEPATGYKGGQPSIFTPVSPNYPLAAIFSKEEPVLTQLQDWVATIGWNFRQRFDDDRQEHRPTFYEPPRTTSTVLRTFTADQYIEIPGLEISDRDVRNVILARGHDRSDTDAIGAPVAITAIATDSDSIDRYGERYAEFVEGSTSLNDLVAKLQDLADGALSDMAEPKTIASVEMEYFPLVELDDFYKFSANGRHFDGPDSEDHAVTGYSHRLALGEFRTVMNLRGKPTARVKGWLGMIANPGVGPNRPTKSPEDPTTGAVVPIANGLQITWDFQSGRLNRGFDMMEVYVGTTAGFTVNSSSLVQVVRGGSAVILDQGGNKTKFVKLIARDRLGNRSDPDPTAIGPTTTRFPAPRPPSARAHLTSDPTLVKDAVIIFDDDSTAPSHDVQGDYDNTTGEFTAPVEGTYNIQATAELRDNSGSMTVARLFVESSGTRLAVGTAVPLLAGLSSHFFPSITATLFLTQSQTVAIHIEHNAGAGDATVLQGIAISYASFLLIAEI